MIDPLDPKTSLLDSVQWTEAELKEYIRPVLLSVAKSKAATFDPGADSGKDSRTILLRATLLLSTANHAEILSDIRAKLDDNIQMTFDRNFSLTNILVVYFRADRFKP